MAVRKNLNPLLESTEGSSDDNAGTRSRTDGADARGSASGEDAAVARLSGGLNVAESRRDLTKSAILRTIDEIKAQMEDERAISEALRKDLDAAKRALADKDGDVARLQAELSSCRTEAGIIEGLKDEIAFMSKELKNVQEDVEKRQYELTDKDKVIKELQGKLIGVEEERSKMFREMKSEMANAMKLQKDFSELSREKEEAIREKAALAAKCKTIEVELERLREESKALEEIQHALTETRRSTRK